MWSFSSEKNEEGHLRLPWEYSTLKSYPNQPESSHNTRLIKVYIFSQWHNLEKLKKDNNNLIKAANGITQGRSLEKNNEVKTAYHIT